MGFGPEDLKTAVAFSNGPLPGTFAVVDGAGRCVHVGRPRRVPAWGEFSHQYELDFGAIRTPGRYRLSVRDQRVTFEVGPGRLHAVPDLLLEFLRQQRCGYNPFLDALCHSADGRSAYGPLPAGSYLDAWAAGTTPRTSSSTC